MTSTKSCLVHGDYSPKNILVGATGVWVVDFEVAHFGDPVFGQIGQPADEQVIARDGRIVAWHESSGHELNRETPNISPHHSRQPLTGPTGRSTGAMQLGCQRAIPAPSTGHYGPLVTVKPGANHAATHTFEQFPS